MLTSRGPPSWPCSSIAFDNQQYAQPLCIITKPHAIDKCFHNWALYIRFCPWLPFFLFVLSQKQNWLGLAISKSSATKTIFSQISAVTRFSGPMQKPYDILSNLWLTITHIYNSSRGPPQHIKSNPPSNYSDTLIRFESLFCIRIRTFGRSWA